MDGDGSISSAAHMMAEGTTKYMHRQTAVSCAAMAHHQQGQKQFALTSVINRFGHNRRQQHTCPLIQPQPPITLQGLADVLLPHQAYPTQLSGLILFSGRL